MTKEDLSNKILTQISRFEDEIAKWKSSPGCPPQDYEIAWVEDALRKTYNLVITREPYVNLRNVMIHINTLWSRFQEAKKAEAGLN